MKKITAILNKNEKLFDKLLGTKERQIKIALDAIQNEIEEQIVEAEAKYDECLRNLGEKGADVTEILKEVLKTKEIRLNGEVTLKALKEIREDLNSEVSE